MHSKPKLGSTDCTSQAVYSSHGQASPQQGDLRLSGPPSGQGAGGGARTRDRMVPADLRADSLATVPPTPQTSVIKGFRMASGVSKDVIKPFMGQGDVGAWIQKVELVAKLTKVKDVASFLPLYLEGNALAVYLELSNHDKSEVDASKRH
ncbi:Pol polyprotein [Plakobranchus ocellatus]|uniref:Pol polyprotein n=1 Tax=Plakobranchus ocellatus TaxID=259542 RepID=A0AAV4CSX9_9GAST|nr:Pol polyprotein [Plakobranchus ocellatus]